MKNIVWKKPGAGCLILVAVAIASGLLDSTQHDLAFAAADNTQPTPVLVELFMSEGCSDCPPADALLQRLDETQFVSGAFAIVLSEHVTYWNHLGWRDPFSFDDMDFRQKEYGERFNLESIYTPQAVIDGTTQLVGNNAAGVTDA